MCKQKWPIFMNNINVNCKNHFDWSELFPDTAPPAAPWRVWSTPWAASTARRCCPAPSASTRRGAAGKCCPQCPRRGADVQPRPVRGWCFLEALEKVFFFLFDVICWRSILVDFGWYDCKHQSFFSIWMVNTAVCNSMFKTSFDQVAVTNRKRWRLLKSSTACCGSGGWGPKCPPPAGVWPWPWLRRRRAAGCWPWEAAGPTAKSWTWSSVPRPNVMKVGGVTVESPSVRFFLYN